MCHNETEQLGNIKFHVELKKKNGYPKHSHFLLEMFVEVCRFAEKHSNKVHSGDAWRFRMLVCRVA